MIRNMSSQNKPMLSWKMPTLADLMAFLPEDTRTERWGKVRQAVQRSCGCPIPGCAQGQVGRGPEQPEMVGGSPASGRGLEMGGL